MAVAAAALLLAAMPGSASANSQQQCKDQWNASPASDTCTVSLDVSWLPYSEECRIKVSCTTSSGSFQLNEVKSNLYLVQHYVNCNGVLKQLEAAPLLTHVG